LDNRNCNLLICIAKYHAYLHKIMRKQKTDTGARTVPCGATLKSRCTLDEGADHGSNYFEREIPGIRRRLRARR
jgi:hypothetical protein